MVDAGLQSQHSSSVSGRTSSNSLRVVNREVPVEIAHRLLNLLYKYTKKVPDSISPLETLRAIRNNEAALMATFIDNKPVAYILVEPRKEECFILQAYSEDSSVSSGLFKYTCKWARKHEFDRITGYVTRHPRAWKRKFDMDVIGYKIGKELMYDGKQASEK